MIQSDMYTLVVHIDEYNEIKEALTLLAEASIDSDDLKVNYSRLNCLIDNLDKQIYNQKRLKIEDD